MYLGKKYYKSEAQQNSTQIFKFQIYLPDNNENAMPQMNKYSMRNRIKRQFQLQLIECVLTFEAKDSKEFIRKSHLKASLMYTSS